MGGWNSRDFQGRETVLNDAVMQTHDTMHLQNSPKLYNTERMLMYAILFLI